MNVIIDGVEYEPIRKPLCEVEGKPVYKGDALYVSGIQQIVVSKNPGCDSLQWDGLTFDKKYDLLGMPLAFWSWNPPKPKTVMVELSVKSAEELAKYNTSEIGFACKKALDKIQDC